MSKRAIYPGSFDPMTNGHLDILDRSLRVFDEVIVVVAGTSGKKPLFELKERVDLVKKVVKGRSRVWVDEWSGLMMDYAQKNRITAVIRGLRAASDFEYEFMMASMNKNLAPEMETVFMMTSKDLYFVSSSMIKELHHFGGDISAYVPKKVVQALSRKR